MTASGWVMYGSPLLRIWPLVGALGHGVGPLDDRQVGLGVGRPDGAQQRLEHRVDVGARAAEAGQPRPHRARPSRSAGVGSSGGADSGDPVGGAGSHVLAHAPSLGALRR